MINLITEKQKVQAIVPGAVVSQELDDFGIYYTIVQQNLTISHRLKLSLLFPTRKVTLKREPTGNKFTISTTYP